MTAFMLPICITVWNPYAFEVVDFSDFFTGRIFGVIPEDVSSNYAGLFQASWYTLNAEPLVIQLGIYFTMNGVALTYMWDVFPKWCRRRMDRRSDYSEEDEKNNIPNTQQES